MVKKDRSINAVFLSVDPIHIVAKQTGENKAESLVRAVRGR